MCPMLRHKRIVMQKSTLICLGAWVLLPAKFAVPASEVINPFNFGELSLSFELLMGQLIIMLSDAREKQHC